MKNPWSELCTFEATTPGWYLFSNEAVDCPVPYLLDKNLKWFHMDLDSEGDNPFDPEFGYTHYMRIPKIK